MELRPESAVMLIPSLEPDDRLPAYLRRLMEAGFTRAVIIDDGSSEKYQPIFEELDAMEGVTVLHHEVNRGKGCALKTGFTYIRDNIPEASGVITADADGQHTVEDCWKLACALTDNKRALYLGSRDFDLPDVPPKSRFGNKTTTLMLRLLYGQWLPDTQPGPRAFKREDLQFMIDVSGERFEYEMEMLIACARAKIPMIPITIQTVYENENEGTHFRPIRDSLRIYKVILGSFIKFMGASLASFLIDQGVFNLMDYVLLPLLAIGGDLKASLAVVIARCISAPCNFLMNRNLVFKFKQNTGRTALRYAILAIVIMGAGAGIVGGLKLLGMSDKLDWLAKLVVDTALYLVSYSAQDKWVFAPEKAKK